MLLFQVVDESARTNWSDGWLALNQITSKNRSEVSCRWPLFSLWKVLIHFLWFLLSVCTREPIGSEVHGRDFLFVTQEEFETFVNTNRYFCEGNDVRFDFVLNMRFTHFLSKCKFLSFFNAYFNTLHLVLLWWTPSNVSLILWEINFIDALTCNWI